MASDLFFFFDPCTKLFGLQIRFFVCTQTCRLQSLFLILAQKNFDQARQREQHKYHDKESLSMILWGSMLFDCVRELVCSLLAFSIAHVKKHTLKQSSGHAGNQKHTWVGYPSVSSFGQACGTCFCQVDMDSRPRPPGRHAEAIGERALSTRKEIHEISSPYLSSSHCWSRCTSTIPLFKMVSSFPMLGAEKSRQRTFRLS